MKIARCDGGSHPSPVGVGVLVETGAAGLTSRARALAKSLSLPFFDAPCATRNDIELVLVVTPRRIELREMGRRRSGSVVVDFLRGSVGHRLQTSRAQRVLLARAVGLRRGFTSVVDATAGLGCDALTLAACGCRVTAIERSKVLGALLKDGLARAASGGRLWIRELVDRVTLVVDDARDVLARMNGHSAPEVVYLDPMYPEEGKKALAKKEMRICRRLVGDDSDAAELFEVARNAATRRVVVKRPLRAKPLAPLPTAQLSSKQIRFDIYSTARA